MSRRIVLCAAGSLGDLHPFIALGLALKARGFEVEVASSAEYRPKIETAGLIFREVGPSLAQMEIDLGMSLAQITERIIADDLFLFRRILLPYLEDSVRQMTVVSKGAAAIVGGTLTLGASMAAEKLGLPYVPVLLQPALAFSAYDPPCLRKAGWMTPATGGWGLWRNQVTLRLARLSISGLKRPLNRVRARLGLGLGLETTGTDFMFDAGVGVDLLLGLYSPLLGRPQPDSPPGFYVAGYAMYDSEVGGSAPLPSELEQFLVDGPAPIVFTLGSAAVNIPGQFYAESLKAARRLGRRAVLLVGPEGDRSVADGPDAIAVRYAPFSKLFHRACAIVHQGGVGTTQQALQSGRPQLVVPHLGDQFDNAARIVRLGCGATLGRIAYRDDRAAQALDRLTNDPTRVETARRLGVVARQEDGAAVGAERIIALIDAR